VDQSASRDGQSYRVCNSHIFRLRDGMVTEFWDASTDQYRFDELLG
jgi:hypothetical protein